MGVLPGRDRGPMFDSSVGLGLQTIDPIITRFGAAGVDSKLRVDASVTDEQRGACPETVGEAGSAVGRVPFLDGG